MVLFGFNADKGKKVQTPSDGGTPTDGYKVKDGDTFYSIARKNGISVKELLNANGMSEKTVLKAGCTLTIPKHASVAQKSSAKKNAFDRGIIKEIDLTSEKDIPDSRLEQPFGKYYRESRHVVSSGESLSKIESKYGLLPGQLAEFNNLKSSALSIGQKIKIPPHVQAENVKSRKDVARATGLSEEYLIKLEEFEGKYNSKGSHPTIGIGHFPQNDFQKKYYSKTRLNDKQVYTLLAKDLIEAQDVIRRTIGETAYQKLAKNPNELAAVTDFVFNRGSKTFCQNSPKLLSALKKGDKDAIAANLDHNIDFSTKEPCCGISKRRLYEISLYCNGNIGRQTRATINRLYKEGLRDIAGRDSIIVGFKKEVNEMFAGRIKF